MAALGAVLQLHNDPDRLAQTLPALRLLTRSAVEIEALARRLRPALAAWAGARADVDTHRVLGARGEVHPASERPRLFKGVGEAWSDVVIATAAVQRVLHREAG